MPQTEPAIPAQSKLPYVPPAYEVDGIFETLALGCHVKASCGWETGVQDKPTKCCNISYS